MRRLRLCDCPTVSCKTLGCVSLLPLLLRALTLQGSHLGVSLPPLYETHPANKFHRRPCSAQDTEGLEARLQATYFDEQGVTSLMPPSKPQFPLQERAPDVFPSYPSALHQERAGTGPYKSEVTSGKTSEHMGSY